MYSFRSCEDPEAVQAPRARAGFEEALVSEPTPARSYLRREQGLEERAEAEEA